jgi:cyclopropane fatty-acyl-phospholipid synthase-like methyltransferase
LGLKEKYLIVWFFWFRVFGFASCFLGFCRSFCAAFSTFRVFSVRYRFSLQVGNLQNQIWTLVLANLDWKGEGRALDIGCGNGALTIELAQKYPNARVIGIDYWGKVVLYDR